MNNLAEITGRLIIQVLQTAGQLILVAALIAAKVLQGILKLIASWIENILSGAKGH